MVIKIPISYDVVEAANLEPKIRPSIYRFYNWRMLSALGVVIVRGYPTKHPKKTNTLI